MISIADRIPSAADTATVTGSWGGRKATFRPVRVRPRPSTGSSTSVRARRARRILNVAVATVGIMLTWPVMILVAILVKLTSPGPVLYTQLRVGIDRRQGSTGHWRRRIDYGGKLFTIYKFRTMTVAPEGEDKQVWASKHDVRITPIGHFLRKYRLDELPQLFNVLRGDMNVVGPRPEQPKIFLELREQVQDYGKRQRLLPGITGWAQVNHHYDQNLEDVKTKVRLDLEYAERESAAEDLRIMARTVPVMLFKVGSI